MAKRGLANFGYEGTEIRYLKYRYVVAMMMTVAIKTTTLIMVKDEGSHRIKGIMLVKFM